MKKRILPFLGIFLGVLTFLDPASAHHGTSAFDMDKLTALKGTVTRFEFMNPHALIYVDVVGSKGEVEHWLAEESSNNHLTRLGWEKNTLKSGDIVTLTGHRARNGARVLELQCTECLVTDAQGKVWPYQ